MTKYDPEISHRNSDGTQGLVCQAHASYAKSGVKYEYDKQQMYQRGLKNLMWHREDHYTEMCCLHSLAYYC